MTDRHSLLEQVAHMAWHLLDDGGEVPDDPGVIHASTRDANRLSDALDALEADGWDAHPETKAEPDRPYVTTDKKGRKWSHHLQTAIEANMERGDRAVELLTEVHRQSRNDWQGYPNFAVEHFLFDD